MASTRDEVEDWVEQMHAVHASATEDPGSSVVRGRYLDMYKACVAHVKPLDLKSLRRHRAAA